jgi:SAM-dependent methyltransferase
MVKIAQKNLPQFKVSQGGVSDMNFDGKFDLITSFFHVLCHLDDNDLNLYFKNVARSLKTGGLACFDVIKLFDVGERGYTESDKKEGKKYLAYHSARKDGSKISDSSGNPIIGTDRLFTREEIADFAAANNFKIIDFAEFQIENPDPKIASLKEYQVILQKG